MFADFLRNFINIDLFKDVRPDDIADVSERFLPLFEEEKNSDTVKVVRIKGEVEIYVIIILEHESKVNHRQAFKMLQYTVMFYERYEKEEDKKSEGASKRKDFKFPPVLPIVFYDGGGEWTAETNFFDKVQMNEIFEKFIPRFEYEVVNLTHYDEGQLAEFGGALSLALIIDKMRIFDFKSLVKKLPEGYLDNINVPVESTKALMDFIVLLLTKIHAPKEDIEVITDYISKKELNGMFSLLEEIDIQAERKARAAEQEEMAAERKEMAAEMRKMAETATQVARLLEEERKAKEEERKAKEEERRKGIILARKFGVSFETISKEYNISVEQAIDLAFGGNNA
jgi:hypothetical protein